MEKYWQGFGLSDSTHVACVKPKVQSWYCKVSGVPQGGASSNENKLKCNCECSQYSLYNPININAWFAMHQQAFL